MTNNSQENNWGNDANAFVAHEDDETQSYSLRVAGLDLLAVSLECFPCNLSSRTPELDRTRS